MSIMSIDVYWNLHRKTFSLRDRRTGLVVGHTDNALLTNVRFIVQPAGLARTRREGRKNVHAFLRGDGNCYYDLEMSPYNAGVEVTYNPHAEGAWVFKANRDQKVPTHTPAKAISLMVEEGADGVRRPVVYAKF